MRPGASRFGSSSDFAARFMVTRLGLDPAKDVTIMHLRYDPATEVYSVYSRRKGDDLPWELHATGRLLPGATRKRPSVVLSDLREQCPVEMSAAGF